MDVELRGLANVKESSVSFLGTKVEVKMKKAEVGSWAKLDVPRTVAAPVKEPTPEPKVQDVTEEVDDLDLDDLEIVASKPTLSKEASAGRTDAEII